MTGLSLLPIFLIGLLGSVHCVGMCGGIVGAFSLGARPVRLGLRLHRLPAAVAAGNGGYGALSRTVCYNIGRIASYATAGAIAGGIATGARALAQVSVLQIAGYWLANLMLVALGLYLMDAWRGLAKLEAAGQTVWRRIQPLTRYLMPLDSPLKLMALGLLWGWLPCGMVYSVLLTAMLTGSALSGAAVMAAFGLGTLPTLLTMGMCGARLKRWMQRRPVRVASGLIILGFGLLGLMRAANGVSTSWLDALCLTPAAAVQR